jgi:hypothetical protein
MKNPPQHKDFDTVVYKLLDATRKAFRKEQHGEAKQYLAEAMQAADRFARYLHTVDGPEVAQKFRQDLKRPVARVAQIMEQHGGRLDGFDVEKLGKTCPHDGVKIGELCKCGALMKHQSLAQQADQQLAKTIARFEAGPTAREKFQYRAGQLKRLLELRKGELEKAKIIAGPGTKNPGEVLAENPMETSMAQHERIRYHANKVALHMQAMDYYRPLFMHGKDQKTCDEAHEKWLAHDKARDLHEYHGEEAAKHYAKMAGKSEDPREHFEALVGLAHSDRDVHIGRGMPKSEYVPHKFDREAPELKVVKSEPLDKAKIIDLKSRKVLADLPSPDAGDKPPHGDLTIQDVRGYPAEQNALRHHLKHMAEHYHSWQNYEGAAAAVSNPVHKKRNLAQAEKHKLAHQTHLNWARGEHSRLKGLPPVHVMEQNALERQEYKSGAMVDKFTPHPDDNKPRPKLVKSEPLDKAKIYSFESKEMLAEQPGRPTARRAEKVVADGSQKVAGQIVPGNQRDEDRASGRTPKNLGVIAGMKVLHGTHPAHKGRAGYHMDNPSAKDFEEGLLAAVGKGMDTIYVHGSRPSTKALKEISRKYPLVPAKSEKENDMKKTLTLRPGQSIQDLAKAGCPHCNMTYAEMGPMKGSFHERGCPMDGAVSCESCGEAVPKREVHSANDWDGLKYCKGCAERQANHEAEENARLDAEENKDE